MFIGFSLHEWIVWMTWVQWDAPHADALFHLDAAAVKQPVAVWLSWRDTQDYIYLRAS